VTATMRLAVDMFAVGLSAFIGGIAFTLALVVWWEDRCECKLIDAAFNGYRNGNSKTEVSKRVEELTHNGGHGVRRLPEGQFHDDVEFRWGDDDGKV